MSTDEWRCALAGMGELEREATEIEHWSAKGMTGSPDDDDDDR